MAERMADPMAEPMAAERPQREEGDQAHSEYATLTREEVKKFLDAFIKLCGRSRDAIINGEDPEITIGDKQLSCDERGQPTTVWNSPYFPRGKNVHLSHITCGPTGEQRMDLKVTGDEAMCYIGFHILWRNDTGDEVFNSRQNCLPQTGICIFYEFNSHNVIPSDICRSAFLLIGLREEIVSGVKCVVVHSICCHTKLGNGFS
eukprot:scpid84016/ scgid30367/ 